MSDQTVKQPEQSYSPDFLSVSKGLSGWAWIKSWIFSTDHKRIGILYLIVMSAFFLVAASLGVMMRLELIAPGKQFISAERYNQLLTLHGVIMVFLFVIPGIPAVFGNFFLPIQIGAKDVAFPRINLLSWWIYVTGAALALLSLFVGEGPANTGWTFYVPFSIQSNTNVTMTMTAAFILGFSSILTGVNFITTIHRMRVRGMGWFDMPLFPWSLYATAWIQVLATPAIGILLFLVFLERVFGLPVFNPVLGGDPILYQHLFWIYSHPAVYVMILPAMGVISEVVPTFSRKHIFGYKLIVYSSLAIAILGSLVWAHHMFTSGMADDVKIIFSFLTYIVALPSAVKLFNWLATMYKGSIHLDSPMLFMLAFFFNFTIGGLTGMVHANLATDIHIHDTMFVVAHFHYMMFGCAAFIFFASMHYWFPKMFGRMFNETVGKISCIMLFVGFNATYFPKFIAGWMGMPRRYWDYDPKFFEVNVAATIGSWILFTAIITIAVNMLHGIFKGRKAKANPWMGLTLEWKVPSPPPVLNFDSRPELKHGPYDYQVLDEPEWQADNEALERRN